MSISGTWYNELGSILTVSSISGNAISGMYNTASGNASGNYPFVGRIDGGAPSGSASATGWTVVWSNSSGDSASATSWTGLYHPPNANTTEEIYTLWFLANELPEEADWYAIHAGQDTFTRTKPSPETVAKARARGMAAHPTAKK